MQEKLEKKKSAIKARVEKQQTRRRRVERSVDRHIPEHSNEKSNLVKLDTPIQMQISAASHDQPNKGPGAITDSPINKLGNPGIKVGGRVITISRPVKVNGELVLKGGKTGAKSRKNNRKLSLTRNPNPIPKVPDPEAKTDQ